MSDESSDSGTPDVPAASEAPSGPPDQRGGMLVNPGQPTAPDEGGDVKLGLFLVNPGAPSTDSDSDE